MTAEYRESFLKDLRKQRDPKILANVKFVIESIEKAGSLGDVANVKKMQGGKGYYRIRVGEFRIGVKVEDETVTFIRFLDRKEIYRYFP